VDDGEPDDPTVQQVRASGAGIWRLTGPSSPISGRTTAVPSPESSRMKEEHHGASSEAGLHDLARRKFLAAGLSEEHADIVTEVLVFADAYGIHSHGVMRVEYYAERIAKGGINTNPNFSLERTGPCTAVFHGDNGAGHVAAKLAMDEATRMAKAGGVAVVGVRKMSHSGALAYFTRQAAAQDLVALSVCQSDPMVVPYGGAQPYYGTNPLAFAAPGEEDVLSFDMATTVQAWRKILEARTEGEDIPEDWAVTEDGKATTDPGKVAALLPLGGPKGYGLGMMVDVLSGVLLGLPFGNRVSSMYRDMREGRDLGQLHVVLNPAAFTDLDEFKKNISVTMKDLASIKPAPGFDRVLYPGEDRKIVYEEYQRDGIEIADEVYEYLTSDAVHRNTYEQQPDSGDDTGDVPEKQYHRWKDDGGALPPES
jgi:ureidoglycolate dehydrogenase (NAD+)